MSYCLVSVGSNVDRERRLREGVAALRRRFGPLDLSPVFESAAVGFDGAPFFNLVLGFESGEPVQAVAAALREVEAACGRVRGGPRFGPRTLDLDLLLYGDGVVDEAGLQLPRPEMETQAFVLWPLAALAPRRRHPRLGLTFAELWARFPKEGLDIRPVDFAWEAA